MKLKLYYPLKPVFINQAFGVNVLYDYTKPPFNLKGHPGQDLIILVNGVNNSYLAPIHASCNGKVSSVEEDSNGGWTVVTITDQEYDYDGGTSFFKVYYSHCHAGSIRVKKDDVIKIGDILALCGASGVTPPPEQPIHAHIHFGVKPTTYHVATTDEPSTGWKNTEQDNGFGGAVDNAPYWNGEFAEDYIPSPPIISDPITQQEIIDTSNWLTKVGNWLVSVLKSLK